MKNMFVFTPKWIKKMNNDSDDKALLLELIKQGKEPINSPREMNFAIRTAKVTQINSESEIINS